MLRLSLSIKIPRQTTTVLTGPSVRLGSGEVFGKVFRRTVIVFIMVSEVTHLFIVLFMCITSNSPLTYFAFSKLTELVMFASHEWPR